jgi:Outer membrane protein
MRRIVFSLIITTLLIPAGLRAQDAMDPMPLSLQDAMDYAVKNNATAKNARLDVKLQKAKNDEITGLAYPNISGKGEFSDYLNPMQSFVPGEFIGMPGTFVPVTFTPKFQNTASVSGSQVLFDGSVMVALQARKAVMQLMETKANATEEDIRYNVQRAYYALVASHRQLDILNSSLKYLRSMLDDLKIAYKEGFVEKIEIDRSQVSLNNLVTDSIRAENLMAVSVQVLNYQMGMDINRPVILTDSSVEDKIIEAQQMLSSELDYNRRTDFMLLQNQLRLNQYDLKRHKLSAVPSLAAFGSASYMYASNNFKDLFKEQYVFFSLIGLQLKVPIFDGLQRHNRVKQARIEVDKTLNNIEYMKLGMDYQESSSKTTLKNALLALETQKRNVELAMEVLEMARKKYNAGVGSNLEVSQAQTEMIAAQANMFGATLDVVNASADLKKALGDFK